LIVSDSGRFLRGRGCPGGNPTFSRSFVAICGVIREIGHEKVEVWPAGWFSGRGSLTAMRGRVDAKCAPGAKHTASRIKLASHAQRITRRASQFSLKINKRQSS
jgi:hypothetical protein